MKKLSTQGETSQTQLLKDEHGDGSGCGRRGVQVAKGDADGFALCLCEFTIATGKITDRINASGELVGDR